MHLTSPDGPLWNAAGTIESVMSRRLLFLALGLATSCGSSMSEAALTPPAGSPIPPANPPPQACGAGGLMSSVGRKHLLVGFSGEDDVATKAPFDLRYQYLAGGIGDPSQNCADYGWWQCWEQNLGEPPHGYVVQDLVAKAQQNGAIAMFTYYEILQASGVPEGGAEVQQAAADPTFMKKYLTDFRTLLDRIGPGMAFIHIEPDFWGYAGQLTIPEGKDAHSLPAAVAASGDCPSSSFEQSIAGLGRCLIAMVRAHSPNAKVGLHASAWGTNFDVLLNTETSFDAQGQGQQLGQFLVSAGADLGDFVVADMSDRDAGCYQYGPSAWCPGAPRNTWWNTDATLPDFSQAFTWSKAVAETVGRPILWWQIPVGNMNQNNSATHWQDNRVDYLFHHASDVVAGGGIGLAFGAGESHQTTPSTDGNYLVDMTNALASGGGVVICP